MTDWGFQQNKVGVLLFPGGSVQRCIPKQFAPREDLVGINVVVACQAGHRSTEQIGSLDYAALERLRVSLTAASGCVGNRRFDVCAHKSIRGHKSNECLECDHADHVGLGPPGTEKVVTNKVGVLLFHNAKKPSFWLGLSNYLAKI